jgi:predicted ATPase/DNA-binding CsgD family transcriptional regulator
LSTERALALARPATDDPPRRDAPGYGLPFAANRLVGRGELVCELSSRLASSRLVTLAGACGIGKSRLAVEVARDWPGEVWYVDLDRCALAQVEPDLLSGPELLPGPDRSALVVFDNYDSQVEAVGEVIHRVLAGTAPVTVLATGRHPLHDVGECVVTVPALPPRAAAELFGDRARARGATIDDASVDVSRIGQLLDHEPLAIELAAARTTVLSLPQLAELLSADRFGVLTTTEAGPARHRSLRAGLDCGWAELDPDSQLLLLRLAVIDGPFTLDGAECVRDSAGGPLLLDALTELVAAGLLTSDTSGPAAVFRLGSSLRRYLAEQPDPADARPSARARLTARLASEIEVAVADVLTGSADTSSTDRLRDLDERARPLLAECRAGGQRGAALRLAGSLGALWLLRGELPTGIATLQGVLAEHEAATGTADEAGDAGDAGDAAAALAALLCASGDADGALRTAALGADAAQPMARHGALIVLDVARTWTGDTRPDETASPDDDALAIAELALTSWRYCDSGQVARAARLADDAVRRVRLDGSAIDVAVASLAAGRAYRLGGEFAAAERLLAEAADAGAKVDVAILATLVGRERGELAFDRGRDDEAREQLRTAIDIAVRLEASGLLVPCIDLIGRIRLRQNDVERARQSFLHVLHHSTSTMHRHAAVGLLGLCEVGLREPGRVASWALHDEAYDIAREVGSPALVGRCQLTASALASHDGDTDRAWSSAADALETYSTAGFVVAALDALDALATLAPDRDDPPGAIRLLTASDALRDRLEPTPARHTDQIEALGAHLDQPELDEVVRDAATMTFEQAIRYATRDRGARQGELGWASLTRAEREVAHWVETGLTNKEVAQRLLVSPRTVQAHLGHIFGKLGISSRRDLAEHVRARTHHAVAIAPPSTDAPSSWSALSQVLDA